jgi:L-ascorbate metabolism protein UlaG (beta-lactamase superfamily)
MRKAFWAGGIAAAIIASLFLIPVAACPRSISLLEYLRTFFSPSPLRVTFLGVSTLLIEDDTQAVMIDGFFSRPALPLLALTPVEPDNTRINDALQQADITTTQAPRRLSLRGVIVNHAHYDHAMDSSDVADRTGAMLVGSESTANIARGRTFPGTIKVIAAPETFCLDRFQISVVGTGHLKLASAGGGEEALFAGDITEPLVPRAIPLTNLTRANRVDEYREGGTFAIFIRYRGIGRALLVQGSAGFAAGALQGRRAHVVYLAVGGLSQASQTHVDSYWSEVVGTVNPRRIVPIHWDGLMGALSGTLAPTQEGSQSLAIVNSKAGAIEVRMPTVQQKVDPFQGLSFFSFL